LGSVEVGLLAHIKGKTLLYVAAVMDGVSHLGALGIEFGAPKDNCGLAAAAFNARVMPCVAYTDPEVAWLGLTKDSWRTAQSCGRHGRSKADSSPEISLFVSRSQGT